MDGVNKYWRPFPKVIRIEPAGACNLACSHCPTGTIAMSRGVMQPATFSMILSNIRSHLDYAKVVVLYHGGEPLLNKNFCNMVGALKDSGILFVKTVTNGMMLPDAQLQGMIQNGLDAIEFSLDGDSPQQNNFIRRDCDYHTVVKNIKRLIHAKRAHQARVPKIFIASTQFVNKVTYIQGQRPVVPAFLQEEFSGAYAGEIADFKCTFAMRWPHMNVDESIYDIYDDPDDQGSSNHCDHVESTMTVRWNGDVVACCYDLTSQYILGNVRDDDLETIWNNRSYLQLRESIEKREFVAPCDNCNVVKRNVYLTLKAGTHNTRD